MSPPSVELRAAVPADAEALTDLHLDCWDDAYTGLVPQPVLDSRRTNVADRVEQWRQIVGDAPETLVAEQDGRLVGFVSAGPGRDNDVDIELEVKALYVRASVWGSGLGHALFETAVGDRAAYVWVLAGNERGIAVL